MHDNYEVYELAEPNGHVFYVGQGVPGRMYQHELEVRRGIKHRIYLPNERYMHSGKRPQHWVERDRKAQAIANILYKDEDILYTVVYRTRDKCKAMAVESERIAIYGLENLTNSVPGQNCNSVPSRERTHAA